MRVCTADKDSLYVRNEVREIHKDQHEERKGQAEAEAGEPQSDSNRDSQRGTTQGLGETLHRTWAGFHTSGTRVVCVGRPCQQYCAPVVTGGSYSTTGD